MKELKPGVQVRLITAPFEKQTIIESALLNNEVCHRLEIGGTMYNEWMLTTNDYVVINPQTDHIDSSVIIGDTIYLANQGVIGIYSQKEAIKKASLFNCKYQKL